MQCRVIPPETIVQSVLRLTGIDQGVCGLISSLGSSGKVLAQAFANGRGAPRLELVAKHGWHEPKQQQNPTSAGPDLHASFSRRHVGLTEGLSITDFADFSRRVRKEESEGIRVKS